VLIGMLKNAGQISPALKKIGAGTQGCIDGLERLFVASDDAQRDGVIVLDLGEFGPLYRRAVDRVLQRSHRFWHAANGAERVAELVPHPAIGGLNAD